MVMQFKQGVRVYTTNNQTVGTVDRVVIDPLTKDVSHIVVRKGHLFTEDKVIPINLIATATEDKITLQENGVNFQALQPFEEIHFIPVIEDEDYEHDTEGNAPHYVLPLYPYQSLGSTPVKYAVTPYPYTTETERHIPDNTVALKEGAQVISADDKHIGKVERLFVDARNNHATYVVVSHGLLFKDRKLVPTTWIKSVSDNEVQLSVKAHILDTLAEFEESSVS
jgi:uncharacterized protein YrrD